MRILLSGATGFVGKKLGLELVRSGHEVVAVVRDRERAAREIPFPFEAVGWGEVPENIDAVIHLAGESIAGGRWTKTRKGKLVQSRLETTQRLVEVIPRIQGRKPRVFLSASAVGYYGDRGDEILPEVSPPSASFLGDLCGRWEEEAFRAACPRVAVFRIGVVLGQEGGALQEMLPIFKRGLGGVLGNGRQWMSWIHWRDLVGIFLHALEDERVRGRFNAVSPEPVTNREFTEGLASALDARVFLPVPAVALKIGLGEMSTILLSSQRCSAEAIQRAGYRFRYPSLSEALKEIFKVS